MGDVDLYSRYVDQPHRQNQGTRDANHTPNQAFFDRRIQAS